MRDQGMIPSYVLQIFGMAGFWTEFCLDSFNAPRDEIEAVDLLFNAIRDPSHLLSQHLGG